QGAVPLVVPHEQQSPALIEDVWGSRGMVPLGQVPTSPEDFHGDGGHGEVDVGLANRLRGHRFHTSLDGPLVEALLTFGVHVPASLPGAGSGEQLLLGVGDAAHGGMSGGHLGGALLGAHLRGSHVLGSGWPADLDPSVYQALADHGSADAETLAEAELALAAFV